MLHLLVRRWGFSAPCIACMPRHGRLCVAVHSQPSRRPIGRGRSMIRGRMRCIRRLVDSTIAWPRYHTTNERHPLAGAPLSAPSPSGARRSVGAQPLRDPPRFSLERERRGRVAVHLPPHHPVRAYRSGEHRLASCSPETQSRQGTVPESTSHTIRQNEGCVKMSYEQSVNRLFTLTGAYWYQRRRKGRRRRRSRQTNRQEREWWEREGQFDGSKGGEPGETLKDEATRDAESKKPGARPSFLPSTMLMRLSSR